jgi:catechol 2,3-dioxygenase-like lactoylglutathione lyase family enzyme
MSVPARLNIVTLGVDDVARSRAFYEALGWEVAGAVGEEICWFRTSDSYVGLWGREDLARDAGLRSEPTAEFGGITLAINVENEEAVTAPPPRRRADPEAGDEDGLGWLLGVLRRPGRPPLGGCVQPDVPDRRRRPHHDLVMTRSFG